MDIIVPLTLETVRLVMHMNPEKYSSTTPEYIYNLFFKEGSHTHIYVLSKGGFFFTKGSDLEGRQYVHVTAEEAREALFTLSLAQ